MRIEIPLGQDAGPRVPFKGHDGDLATRRCKNCDLPYDKWAGGGACPGTKPVPPDEFAVVEVFGHQRHIGRISEVERFGTKMLRVDEPTDVLHDANDMFAAGSTSYFLSGASIFRLTPCTIAVVRVHYARRAPAVGLLSPPRGGYEDMSEDIDDEPNFSEVDEPQQAPLGNAHVKVEGATTCPTCGTPVSDFDAVSCFTPSPNVSRETEGESNG